MIKMEIKQGSHSILILKAKVLDKIVSIERKNSREKPALHIYLQGLNFHQAYRLPKILQVAFQYLSWRI